MNPEIITSTANQRVRNLLKLHKKSERIQQRLILVEGWREIKHAFDGGLQLKTIFLSEEKANQGLLAEASVFCDEIVILGNSVFEKISYRENVEGVLATCKPRILSLDSLHLRPNPLMVVLESVEKPGNLGAILRTAEAAAVDAVLVCDPLTDIFNPNVIRASLGCVFTVPVIACESKEATIFFKEKNIHIIAAALTGSQRYDTIDYSFPTAFVLGSEANGLSDLWLKAADQAVLIPMLGRHDSLNVAASAAILVFEALRQREFKS
ncbi:MAG: TrmH family RNA methyltransferase [Bacteroidales bacterium]